MILGIDPGNKESAFALVDKGYVVAEADKIENHRLRDVVRQYTCISEVVVESIQSYGMPVGREIFDTCLMIGRIQQVADDRNLPNYLYPRPEYARAICGTNKVKDSVLRQALELRFGGYNKGEPLHLLRGTDKRSAFAVAVYHIDQGRFKNPNRKEE